MKNQISIRNWRTRLVRYAAIDSQSDETSPIDPQHRNPVRHAEPAEARA